MPSKDGRSSHERGGNTLDTVALLDPDMLFLRPITGAFPHGEFLVSRDWKKEEVWPRVSKGYPAGQQYGLGAYWLSFNRSYICGSPKSKCVSTTPSEANKYFPVGPPYILHVDDLREVAKSWVAMVPRIYEEYPELLAEMYAYCMASAHLGLKHLKVDHLMVSNVNAGGEGWEWVDAFLGAPAPAAAVAHDTRHMGHLAERSQGPTASSSLRDRFLKGELSVAPSLRRRAALSPLSVLGRASAARTSREQSAFSGNMPSVVHYCQNYRQGDWLFAKRRVPKGSSMTWPPPRDSVLHCAHPLLAEPPPSLATVDSFDHNDGTKKPLTPRQRQRVNFMLVATTRGVNAALESFKFLVCETNHINSSSGSSGGDSGTFDAVGSPSSQELRANYERSFRLVPEHVERKALAEARAKKKKGGAKG